MSDEYADPANHAVGTIDPMAAGTGRNFPLAVVAGTVASIAGAVAWAAVSAITHFQIGFMAVGVGFLTGFTVRVTGKGNDKTFGILGATLALGGCVLGNLLAGCVFVAAEQQVGIMDVLAVLDLEFAHQLLVAMFSPIDLLFYGLAIYEGYRLSFDPGNAGQT